MTETRVTLRSPVAGSYASEIERRLFYVSAGITGFRLVERDGQIHEVVVATDAPADADGLAAKLAHVIETDVLTHRPMPRKVVWESPCSAAATGEVFDDLLARGIAFEAGEGQVAFGEPLIALMDHFDETLTSKVVELFGAREYRYPTLIPTRVLERCGYFNSFPQFLMFVTRLHGDTDTYRAFVADYERDGRVDPSVLGQCDNLDYCLPPTMCFHTFHQYGNRVLGTGDGEVVTAKGKSFRFESRYATSLERLWDFTIREVVFMGSREFAIEARRSLMEAAFAFVTDLGLACCCEVANDPFFCKSDAAEVVLSQRLLELKYELRAHVGPERSIAVASFNAHEDFFSRNFDIRAPDGEPVTTACAGFGLERLVYSFLCHHGLEPAGWPPAVRQALAERSPRPPG
jgi:seryl-tRNA synthetase